MNRSRARQARRKPSAEKRARARLLVREPKAAAKSKAGAKPRALPVRLAAELDALKEELARARARMAELESRVDEDPLTGLLNRRGFERALARALAYVRRYGATAALLFLDLDGFKAVNDRHGHAAGDWVLGWLARLIAGHVRASDVVARIGGDEIVVLLWNLRADQALSKARAIEDLVATSVFAQSGKRFDLGLSAGFTMLAADDTVEAALARADKAMYARKRERRA
ncbi:MAG TPA: GGDEF domain-containing protein [Xanthobacteraceae bacterium]|nr:GGDEF domain-containing protein [Xanthobacteraceae bacterium]